MPNDGWTSRKLILTAGLVAISTVGWFTGKCDFIEWGTFTGSITGLYQFANVFEKRKGTSDGSQN